MASLTNCIWQDLEQTLSSFNDGWPLFDFTELDDPLSDMQLCVTHVARASFKLKIKRTT